MTRREVAALLAYAAKLDPRSAPADEAAAAETLQQWADLLADVPPTAPHPEGRGWDAAKAVRHHIATSQYPVKPADVSRPWHAFRRDILSRHVDPVPAVDPDDAPAYRRALAAQRRAVETGAAVATPRAALTTGQSRQERDRYAADRLAALGGYVPRTVAQELAAYRPRRAERERRATAGLPDPLDVACPCEWCRAPAGSPCLDHHRNPRTAHPTRLDLATAQRHAHPGAA
ncbi:cell surface glycoprotein [Streptomyces sp. NPDC056244]|uniref:zinc finger domain-containing protein n=1 Tax=Streptomyces sp. NPDC056244 TaxID=3345762 RepID=UPI0035D75C19